MIIAKSKNKNFIYTLHGKLNYENWPNSTNIYLLLHIYRYKWNTIVEWNNLEKNSSI